MARGSRSGRSAISQPIASTTPQDPLGMLLRPLTAFTEPVSVISDYIANPLDAVQDMRRFDFEPGRSLTIGGRAARVVVHKRPIIAYGQPIYARRGLPKGLQVPVGVKFEHPWNVVRCLRRKIRREIIFARDKRRKGAGARRRRRNPDSGVSC